MHTDIQSLQYYRLAFAHVTFFDFVVGKEGRDKLEQSIRNLIRDAPARRMIALYDYDPHESSPNVDSEVCYIVQLLVFPTYFCALL